MIVNNKCDLFIGKHKLIRGQGRDTVTGASQILQKTQISRKFS